MFAEHMQRAVEAAPRERLAALAAALWRGHGAGAIGDDDAQRLAELIEARKVVPVETKPRYRAGSRPRSPESMERRRRWVASGLMPPQLAARFTMGEGAALAVVAAEVAKKGACKLTLGHIAALAGVCRSTVRNAIREAVALGLMRSEEWRLSAFRSAPNSVTIVSSEWVTWLRLVRQGRGGVKTVQPTPTNSKTGIAADRGDESFGWRSRKKRANLTRSSQTAGQDRPAHLLA